MTKAGFIALIGAPNAGKSTLMNALLGQKLAIVTPKVQTTRVNLRGILTQDDVQYIFVDTPGIHQPKRTLDKSMVVAAKEAWQEADVVVMLVDGSKKGISQDVSQILDSLKDARKPLLLALNKVDDVKDKARLLPLMEELAARQLFKEILPISALKTQGLAMLLETVAKYLPESPYLFDPESITDTPTRQLMAEFTRERAFMYLQQELPYALMVETVDVEEREDGAVDIHQNILIKREAHKPIVIGKGGAMLKKIGQSARTHMADLLDRPVHLHLTVKIKPNWDENPWLLREMGLSQDK